MRQKQHTYIGRLFAIVCAVAFAVSPCARAAEAATRKVLIVTGIDYPGHKWQETAPALAEVLRQDTRLKVDVVETPEFLASPKLNDYDSVVLHFMNWESPDPGEQARANLARFVSDGGGLVLVHFACGAFQGWKEFEKLAGRVYDPNLRPHDPYGSFEVRRTDVEHPITHDLKPFEIVDELYTCLAGDTAIQTIAEAKSKVDGKDYPMAFVLQYGKGHVFHSPLGHDVGAITNPGAAELFRRGCAWTAGLTPVAGAKQKKIAFIAGKPSHGDDIHGWDKDAEFVRQCLLEATNIEPLQIEVHHDGWPQDPAALNDADAIVFFADGRELHPLKEPERAAKIRELAKQGKGLAFLHYCVDPPEGLQEDMRNWIGGCYQVGLSQNPINVVKVAPVENGHPITLGCGGYVAEDEWYFDIGFRPNDANVVPILTGRLPPRDPQDKVLAWAYTRPDGGRGFGFVGGHPDENWHMEPFRKLVLNAIVWLAKAEVPEGGVASTRPWRFVSIPNFVSVDLAYPQPGWEDALGYILDAIKAENPEFVLVPGDLVMGCWPDKESIEKLAEVYFPAWTKRMDDHGLKVYAAVGDHEIGGAPWPSEKAALVRTFKRQFQKHLRMPLSGPLRMKGTAYWFIHENTLVAALDVFEKGSGPQGEIAMQVTGEQLQWLDQVLTDNPGAEHIVVMGHAPILPCTANEGSDGLMVEGGEQSPLWQTLKKHHADLYLCAQTCAACTEADGILQVAHGASWGKRDTLTGRRRRDTDETQGQDGLATISYLVATVYQDRIDLEIKEIATVSESERLWQMGDSRPSRTVTIPSDVKQKGFTCIGKAILRTEGNAAIMENTTGCFAHMNEATDQ